MHTERATQVIIHLGADQLSNDRNAPGGGLVGGINHYARLADAAAYHRFVYSVVSWTYETHDFLGHAYEKAPAIDRAPIEIGPPPVTREDIKALARRLDPECWVSYSGKPREFKRAIDKRRNTALEQAEAQLGSR